MGRADRIVARAQAAAVRDIGRAVADAIRSPDPAVRADALALARELLPPQPSLLDIMRVSRGTAPANEAERSNS